MTGGENLDPSQKRSFIYGFACGFHTICCEMQYSSIYTCANKFYGKQWRAPLFYAGESGPVWWKYPLAYSHYSLKPSRLRKENSQNILFFYARWNMALSCKFWPEALGSLKYSAIFLNTLTNENGKTRTSVRTWNNNMKISAAHFFISEDILKWSNKLK